MLKQAIQFLVVLSLLFSAAGFVQAGPAVQAAPQAVVGQNSAAFLGVRPGDVFPTAYVEIPYNDPALETFSAITIEAWVKRADATRSEVILCNDIIYSYCLSFAGSQLKLNLRGAAPAILSLGSVQAGIWTHVAASYDGSYVRLYINGQLDSTAPYSGGVGRPVTGTALGIGADVPPWSTDFNQNYFAGLINNVRLWDVARTGAEIRSTMFSITDSGAPSPRPLGEWRLAGDVLDTASSFNGIAHNLTYVNDGALPHDIRIPLVSAAPALDGSCDATKYAGAIQQTVSNSSSPSLVSLMRTATDLWVCFDNLTAPSSGHDNWAGVYLDPGYTRHALSQSGDVSLEVHNNNSLLTRAGNGVGDYTVTNALDGQWNGIYTSHFNGFYSTYTAEFRISNSLFGGAGAKQIGLALAQHWITGPNDDRLWPALSTYNSPATWSAATLSGPGTPRTFSGQVLYATRVYKAPMPGIGGVPVNLVGYDSGGSSSIVASAKSNTNGIFNLTSTDSFSGHRLEVDPLAVPKGLSADYPTAPAPGSPAGPLAIDYGAAAGAAYGGNNFIFSDQAPHPLDTTLSPYLQIITSQAIASYPDLHYYLDFKRNQGFTVDVATVEDINAAAGGGLLTVQKIRNFEISRRAVIGPAFKYVLLIGWKNTIPYGDLDGGAADASHCLTHPGWPTDWFYVDLTSNWDSNNNGCFGDGIFGDKAVQQANNYTPDASGSLFQKTVALGRIPINDPMTAIRALLNSMYFEQQNGDFKRQALLASTMMDMKAGSHACWLPPDDPSGGWFGPGDHTVNGVKYSCASVSGTGTDGSYLSEAIRAQSLAGLGFAPTLLYENGNSASGGSPFKSPATLSESKVKDALYNQPFGLVQFMGHGNGSGVYRLFWSGDANLDGAVNNPTQPIGNPAKSAWEVGFASLATSYTGLGAWGSKAPIFVMASCSTGQFDRPDSFGANLLSNGEAVAWVGGVAVVPYSQNWTQPGGGNMQDIAFYTTRLLLNGGYRLGDAVWGEMADYMAKQQAQRGGWWALDFDLYGDPTLTYFGNPAGNTNGAAWPMLRNNAPGLGYTSLTGPVQPTPLWSYPANARVVEPLKPSPLVTKNNDVVAGYFNFVDLIRGGVALAHLPLSAPVFGSPALAADGTIYAVTIGGKLYAFAPSGPSGSYIQRWTTDLGAIPTTSPIIGPDGFIAIGHQRGATNVSLIRPDGSLYRDLDLGGGDPVGAIAIAPDRTHFITTTAGKLVAYAPFCGIGVTCFFTLSGPSPFTTPPLVANNSVYAGRADGAVIRYDPISRALLSSFTADSAIVLGPLLGPGGQVLVASQNGTFYSLSNGLSLRWQKSLDAAALNGQPAFTANGLYIADGDSLLLLDPASGAFLNSVFLNLGAGGGTVAAGYNRQLFVQTGQGPIVAVGENWLPPVSQVLALPAFSHPPGGGTVKSVQLQWAFSLPLAASGGRAAPSATSATGILVQRSLAGGPWQDLVVLPATATAFEDTSIQPGADYAYRLQVLDANGNDSDFSQAPDPLHSYPDLPAAPLISAVTASGATSLQVAWSNLLGPGEAEVSSYRLERAALSGGPYTTIANLSKAAATFDDTGLAPNTAYFYRLYAANLTGESAVSAEATATTRSLSLAAPQLLALANPGGFNYELSWAGTPALPGIQAVVEVEVDGQQGFTQVALLPGAGPYNFEQVNPGRYTFRVKFLAGNSESPYTSTSGFASLANFLPFQTSMIYLPVIKK